MKKILLIFTVLCCSVVVSAQEKTFKYYYPASYWTILRGDYYFSKGSFAYYENNLRFQSAAGINNKKFLYDQLYIINNRIGYQHKASDNWYVGAWEKFVTENRGTSFYTGANVLHTGKIFGKLDFLQQLTFEYLKFPKSDNPNIIVNDELRWSLLFLLQKEFKLSDRPLNVAIAFRGFQYYELKSEGNNLYSERFLDKTRYGILIQYLVHKNLFAGIFALRETDYFYRSGFDEANLNNIRPTYGLSLNLIFNTENRKNPLPGMPLF